jgi:hypothetical protein
MDKIVLSITSLETKDVQTQNFARCSDFNAFAGCIASLLISPIRRRFEDGPNGRDAR